jgi:hypothetical protein
MARSCRSSRRLPQASRPDIVRSTPSRGFSAAAIPALSVQKIMTAIGQLPELPLMLAGVPRAVETLLREAGVPAEALPRVPLLAAGVGRFVLYDSKNARSAARARRAESCGLKPIDLREFLPAADDFARLTVEVHSGWKMGAESTIASSCLEKLKAAVEALGGVWVRLADYPFPYQSAICLAVEHHSEELADFRAIAASLPGRATHFVSSRLRADRLAFLSEAGSTEVGWQILPADCQGSIRSTLSHWQTRIARFAAANVQPVGLAIRDESLPAPAIARLRRLGMTFSCLESADRACRVESSARATDDVLWTRFSVRPLPTREMFVEWVGEHYQSGSPLFLAATTERLDLVQELLRLSGDAGRCSLMWQTSFREFSRWWAARRRARLQVWRTETGLTIQATGEFGPYPRAVEIWRGSHLATLPLRQPDLIVADEGLVYLQSTRRNPAGCTTPGAEISKFSETAPGEPLPDPSLTRSRFRRKGSSE